MCNTFRQLHYRNSLDMAWHEQTSNDVEIRFFHTEDDRGPRMYTAITKGANVH